MHVELIFIPLLLALLIPVVEDWRSRSINWYWIPINASLLFVFSWLTHENISSPLQNLAFNISMLSGIFLLLGLYLMARYGYKGGFINRFIGLGDVLMLFSASSLFRPSFFILFLTATFFTALVGQVLFLKSGNSRSKLIPLVSYLNFILALTLSFDHYFLDHFLILQSETIN